MTATKKVFFLLVVMLMASGCTIQLGGSSQGAANDGGVWKSLDGGKTWSQVVEVAATGGKKSSIANINVTRMIFDPQDNQTLYLSTEKNGIVYTYDGGAVWRQFKELNSGAVAAVAVDAQNKCLLYAITGNKLYKSVDCGRFWDNIYFHPKSTVVLTDVVVDYKQSGNVYLTTNAGEILKSVNGGQSWTVVYNLKSGVFSDILMDDDNPAVLYAVTDKKGLYKTVDGGGVWSSLGEGLKSYTSSHEFKSLIVDQATADSLLLISKYGALRSANGGQDWTVLNLLPEKKSAVVYTAAIDPKDSKKIYYATDNSLVSTTDGGATWTSKKLPFSRTPTQILVDPKNTDVIYLSTLKTNK